MTKYYPNVKTARAIGICANCGSTAKKLFRVFRGGVDRGKWCKPCRREMYGCYGDVRQRTQKLRGVAVWGAKK